MKKSDYNSKEFWDAVYHGEACDLQRLLDLGAGVDEVFPVGPKSAMHNVIRPLLAACQTAHYDKVKLLLERGAHVHGHNQWMTPYAVASIGECPEILELLLANGAEPNLFSWVALGDIPALEEHAHELPEDLNITAVRDEAGSSLLHYAVAALQVETVKFLLNKGADSNTVNENGATALHRVVDLRQCDSSKRRKVVRMLLDFGADVNLKDRYQVSPLHKAVRARSVEAVELLLNSGADVDAVDKRGSTPLRRAVTNTGAGATKGKVDEAFLITEKLLAAGANPMAVSKDGRTIEQAARGKEMKALIQSACKKH